LTRGQVTALRIAAAVVPVVAFLLLLHYLAPALQTRHRENTLPEGYRSIGSTGPYEFFARPENAAAREACWILDRFRAAVFAEYSTPLHLTPRDSHFQVIVFSNQTDLMTFARDQLGSDFTRNAGFYIPDWRAMGVVGDGDLQSVVRPLMHEGMHMILDTFVEGGGHEWSRWLDEGLATYFEASDLLPDGRIRLGGLDPLLTRRLKASPPLGLIDLLRAGDEEFEGDQNLLYYGTSALFVHYFLTGAGDEGRKRFFTYYELERSPGPVPAGAFERVFGDPETLQLRLRAHLHSL
jgi:hypothetical protein